MSTTMTIRLESELKSQLDELAKITDRSKSYLAAEAIREFVQLNDWQLREIRQAVSEADKGEFASNQDVEKVLKKWGVSGN